MKSRVIKLYMTYAAKTNEVGNNSWAMVKRINMNWAGGSVVEQ